MQRYLRAWRGISLNSLKLFHVTAVFDGSVWMFVLTLVKVLLAYKKVKVYQFFKNWWRSRNSRQSTDVHIHNTTGSEEQQFNNALLYYNFLLTKSEIFNLLINSLRSSFFPSIHCQIKSVKRCSNIMNGASPVDHLVKMFLLVALPAVSFLIRLNNITFHLLVLFYLLYWSEPQCWTVAASGVFSRRGYNSKTDIYLNIY